MATTTPNYGWTLPGVNDPSDANRWGTQLNSNLSDQDTIVKQISDVADSGAPVVADYKWSASSDAQSLWLLCDHAAVDRTTYAALFAKIGTTYGAGNGTTTFNVPDLRGRTLFGVDNMGGSAASRVTIAGSGISGTAIGATGGDQLTQQHTHIAVSVVTDPGHVHYYHGNSAPSGAAASIGTTNISGTDKPADGFVRSSTTGVTVGTTNADYSTGAGQNMPPTMMGYIFIFAGV